MSSTLAIFVVSESPNVANAMGSLGAYLGGKRDLYKLARERYMRRGDTQAMDFQIQLASG